MIIYIIINKSKFFVYIVLYIICSIQQQKGEKNICIHIRFVSKIYLVFMINLRFIFRESLHA
jgi:hypothetical protein